MEETLPAPSCADPAAPDGSSPEPAPVKPVLAPPEPVLAPPEPAPSPAEMAARLREVLGRRPIVLVGLMGAGKTTVGRRLGQQLGLPFRDADVAIETAAGMPIPDIFARFGEDYFRSGERRVIARLLDEGATVLATGGGAFMHPDTRARIAAAGISVWLKAELDVLMQRVRKRSNRPLLHAADPESTMKRLISERYPIYAEADVTIETRDVSHHRVALDVVAAVHGRLLGREGGR